MCQTQKLRTLKSVQEDKTHRKRLKFVSVVDRRSDYYYCYYYDTA